MSNPSSLRDLYNTPPSPWTFVPPPINGSTSSVSQSNAAPPPSYSFPARPRPPQNSIFELSPALADPGGADMTLLLKTLVANAFLEYASNVVAMPWEVGKCLLQVQWVPRDAGEPEEGEPEAVVEEVAEEQFSDDSGEDSYFADPSNPSSGPSRGPPPRPVDDQGYVLRKSVMEEGTRPEYVIPVGSADGVWSMIKRVGRFKNEGWLSLWKGLLTTTISGVLSSNLQPLIHTVLQSMFSPSPSFSSPYLLPTYSSSVVIPVLSHLITGFLLSPLDLIRTRLIVQSALSKHRRYSGPLDALRQIIRDEGGIRGMYMHPHLLIPTLLDNTLRPLISLMLPPLIATRLFSAPISIDTHPIAWGFVEFTSYCIGTLVTLPFETVRRRLQVQVRGRAQPLKTCVETRPAPYNGVVDTMWHILTEERSDLPIRQRRRTPKGKGKAKEEDQEEDLPVSWWRYTGLGQLYRGLGMRLSAGIIVFVLGVAGVGEDADAGWAEL
ncbi:mitochondrial carrier [Dentipellis sp. KUC8613]|nr:mitochondrial carrier [Dentipellis sp. KUC8613]